jgi:hypothetical protein
VLLRSSHFTSTTCYTIRHGNSVVTPARRQGVLVATQVRKEELARVGVSVQRVQVQLYVCMPSAAAA